MRKGWEIKKLADVVDFQRGLTYSKKDEVDFSDNIVLRSNNVSLITNKLDFSELKYINSKIIIPESKKVTKGSLIICTANGSKSHLGKVALIDDDYNYAFGGFMGLIKTKQNLNPIFLYYLMTSDAYKKFINKLSDGANINNLKFSDLGDFEIPIPPLSEQQELVAIIDDAFESIERAKSNAEQNLKNAKELFNSYLQNIFENKGEDWDEITLEEATDLISKGSSPKWQGIKYVDEPGVLFITSENVGENTLILKERKYVEEKFNQKERKSILKNGDVLTNIVGASIGRTALFNLDENSNINQAVCLIRCKNSILSNEFLTYLLNSPFVKIHLHENEVNNARANLSLGFFRSLTIPLPKLEVQKTIVEKIKSFHLTTKEMEVVYQKKIDNIIELKKSILQKVFNGELETSKISA
jgi:type I restriction enzyme S subunit